MTVVPMRLCTIYRSEEQVHEMLARERALLSDALRRLEGKTEWGVKLVAEPAALERAAVQAGEDDSSTAGPGSEGTAYMDRKRREARARDEGERVAEEWARDVHERLAEAASEALLNPVQRPEVSGYEGEMLLNGVYLVTEGEVESFRRLVEQLAEEYRERGALVDLTGPWPPYNFVKSSIEAAR
jgi:Gas vesicle synthesis protein GvpL/GvpF